MPASAPSPTLSAMGSRAGGLPLPPAQAAPSLWPGLQIMLSAQAWPPALMETVTPKAQTSGSCPGLAWAVWMCGRHLGLGCGGKRAGRVCGADDAPDRQGHARSVLSMMARLEQEILHPCRLCGVACRVSKAFPAPSGSVSALACGSELETSHRT